MHEGVVVIGGGVIGCAVAWELARQGMSVTVMERGEPGHEATWAAGGMLSPLSETAHADAFLALSVLSLDRWPAFASRIAAAVHVDVEYRPAGKLHLAFSDEDAARLEEMRQRGDGFGVQWLSAAEAVRLEPAMNPALTGALLVGRDHRVNNRLLGQALWMAAEQAGVQFRLGTAAEALEIDGSSGEPRVTGVRLAGGESVPAEAVIVAAGAWSQSLAGLPRAIPVAPVRGQMFAVDAEPGWLTHTIEAPGCYLIPRESGRVVVGATSERVDFAPGPTPSGIAALMQAAAHAAPGIAEMKIAETWAGYRPGTPDDLPILGMDPAVRGLCYATGHYRNGVLLAPVTAEIVAALITSGTSPVDIAAFRPDRFEA